MTEEIKVKEFLTLVSFPSDEEYQIYAYAQLICGANPKVNEEDAIEAVSKLFYAEEGFSPRDAYDVAREAAGELIYQNIYKEQ